MVGLDNPLHILIVLVVVLMVFGAKRLPEMGKGIGEGMRGFKQAISGETPPTSETPHLSLTPVEEPAVVQTTTPQTAAVERETAPIA